MNPDDQQNPSTPPAQPPVPPVSPPAPQPSERVTGADALPTSADIAPADLKNPLAAANDDESLESPLELINRRRIVAEDDSQAYRRGVWRNLQTRNRLVLAVLTVVLIASGSFAISSFGSGSKGNKNGSQTGSNFANLAGNGSVVANDKQSKLQINYDTLITPGRTLTVNGSVVVQNDLANGFSVQNAAGDNLVVADTTRGQVGIGQTPTGTARLQVNGNVSVNGNILSPNGGFSLGNQGLTLNGVLVCTAAGCIPNASQQLSGYARLSGNNDFTGVNSFTAAGNVFRGDGSGLSALNAGNITAGTLGDNRLSGNVALASANNNFTGTNTFSSQIQASGGVDAATYSVGGTAGAAITCTSGDLIQNATVVGGIITGGSCVPGAGASIATLQESYDASAPARIVLSSASGTLQLQDAATPLGTNLFEVASNGGGTKYFAVSAAGATVTGTFNATTLQQGGIGVLTTNSSFGGDVTGTYSALTIKNGAVNSSKILDGTITNADINAAAAIAYSKLSLSGSIVNTDINAGAGIAYSKLNLTGGVTNADINAAAAIAYSKLNLAGNIVNADISAAASISYSKLNLSGSVTNTDIAAGAGIAYSKLNLNNSITNADISTTAGITDDKLAQITSANKVADSALSSNVTKQGNSFNGASQLLQLNGSGKVDDTLLSGNVALKNADNTFTGNNIFSLGTAGLAVEDAASPLGTNLFEVDNNDGTTKYFTVSSTALQFLGNDVCTTGGNCAGAGNGGGITGTGSQNTLTKFDASGNLINSIISDDGSTATVGGTLSVNTITPTATLTIGTPTQTLTLQGDGSTSLSAKAGAVTNKLVFVAPSGSDHTINIPNASGTVAVSASGPLSLDAAGNLTCPTCLTSGGAGAGVSSVNTLTGDLTIAGTLNQIIVTPSGGNTLTLSTPQDIDTTSTPDFAGIKIGGSAISSSDLSDSTSITKQGNSFNGNNQLVQTNGSGKISNSNLNSDVALTDRAGGQTFTTDQLVKEDSATAFQVQDSLTNNILAVDSTNNKVIINNLSFGGTGNTSQTITKSMTVTSAVTAHDVVVIDTATPGQVTTTATGNSNLIYGVATATKGAGQTQDIVIGGTYQVNVDATSTIAVGDFIATSSTAGKVTSNNNPAAGTILGRALSAVVTPGAGQTVWVQVTPDVGGGSAGTGVTGIGTIDSQTKSADGGVISGTLLYLQTADAGAPGLVSTTDQTFAGNKTFSDTVNATTLQQGGVDVLLQNTSFSGDVSGSYSSLSVDKIAGTALSINTLADTDFLIYNSSTGNWENHSISGDITVDNTGAATIGVGKVTSSNIADGTITNADISGTAAIDYSKLNLNGSIQDSDVSASSHFAFTNVDNNFSADQTFGANLSLTGSAAFSHGTDYATAGVSNDVSFGNTSLVRLTGASVQTITGIAAGRDGQLLTIVNAASQAAIISNLNAGSAAANQITTGTGADYSLPVGSGIGLVYDSQAALWRVAATGTGINDVGAIDTQTASSDGAVVVGNSIYLQSASDTAVGLVNTSAQTFHGDKTFSGLITGNAGITVSGGAVSLQGNAASSLATTSGSLSLQGAGGVDLTTTDTASGNSSDITIASGNVTAGVGTSGSISVDVGTSTGATGTISIGTVNASAVRIGLAGKTTTVNGALTVSQLLTATSGINVAANQTVNFAGGSTASRPGSPAAGTLYFDTDTNQLIQYNGTKWVSDRSTATKIVAASNSTQAEKDAADYIATGTDDATTINSALTALPAGGGIVYLEDGTYTLGTTAVSVPNNTTLSGSGAATILKYANSVGSGTYKAITNSDTATGTNVNIQNLLIDGNKANQVSGSFYGIYFSAMGSGTRIGGKISGVTVQGLYGGFSAGIYLTGSSNNTIVNNTTSNSAASGISNGIELDSSSNNNSVTGNTANGNNYAGIFVQSSSNNSITGNTTNGNANCGIDIVGASATNNTVTGNTTSGGGEGIYINGAGSNNTITGNTVSGATYGIYVQSTSGNNLSGNSINGSTSNGFNLFSSTGNIISTNKISNIGNGFTNNAIYLSSSSTKNSITGNDITDTSCTTTCYAINISDVGSTGNYLASNHFLGDGTHAASINDATGGGNTYSGQPLTENGDASFRNATNSTTAFQVQNAAGTAVLTADTSAGKVVLGTAGASGITGTLQFNYSGSAGSTTLVALDPASGTYTISLPAENGTICTTGSVCTGYQAAVTGGAANQQLSNLSGTVAINQSLNPNADNTLDLGSAANSWRTLYSDTSVITPTVDTGSAIALNIGTSSSVINLNQSTTIAAGKSLKITGDITANRPSSPTAGTLFYDTTTNQLIQYNGTKWVSDRSTATKIVAASNSTQAEKDAADYVAAGNTDESTINSALNALPSGGGRVYLMEGTYNIGLTGIKVPNDTTLAGAGTGTVLKFMSENTAGQYFVISNKDTSTATHVNIENLLIDGNKTNTLTGQFDGIYFNGVGSAASSRDGGKITNVVVQNVKTHDFYLNNSANNTITGNTVTGAGNVGLTITGGGNNVVANNTFENNQFGVAETVGSNVYTGNIFQNNSLGAMSSNGANSTITGNTFISNLSSALTLSTSGAKNNIVNGNKFYDNGGATDNKSIVVSGGATNNSITGNDITDTSCTTTCYAISFDATSTGNYLASNHFLGDGTNAASINDATGGGNTYANQQLTSNANGTANGDTSFRNGTNSATAFQVQNAAGVSVLTADTSAGKVVLGKSGAGGLTGTLQFNYSGSAGSTTLVALDPASGTYTISLPAENGTICTTGSVCTGYQAAGSYATTALDNLSGVAINANLTPNADNTLDLGTAANSWRTLYADTSVVTPTVDTGSAIALNIGTSSSVINLNQSTVVAAGKSLRIIGDITANRPASPTAGMLFYDTTTNQLLQYNGTKWISDRSTATKIVAASNSTQAEKDAADYVATGAGDQVTINSALTAAAGGTVYLMEGTYTISASISVPNNTTLAGAGAGTVITIPNGQNGAISMITNSDTAAGTGVTVRDLLIDGNKANQTAGAGPTGVYFNGVGAGAGTRKGGLISNVIVKNLYNFGTGINLFSSNNNVLADNTSTGSYDGIFIQSSSNNTAKGNTAQGNGRSGIYLLSSTNNALTGNIAQGNGTGIYLDQSSGGAITGNVAEGNSSEGVSLNSSSNNTITGNSVADNGAQGIGLTASQSNTVSGNKIADNGDTTANNSIYLISSSTKNSITGNDITDTSCTTTCYAINVSDAGSTSNYISSNHFLGDGTNLASINDATGGGNTYSNQQLSENGDASFRNATNSATAFQVQNASGRDLLNIDTSGSALQVGNTTDGSQISLAASGNANATITKKMPVGGTVNAHDLVVIDSSTDGQVKTTTTANDTKVFGIATGSGTPQDIVIGGTYQVNLLATNQAISPGDYLVSTTTAGAVDKASGVPPSGTAIGEALESVAANTGGTVWVYVTPGAGGTGVGGSTTLQQAYDYSTSSPQITLDSSPGAGGLVIQDASTPLGTSLFTIQSNGGGSTYLDVAASTVSVGNYLTLAGGQSQDITTSGGTDLTIQPSASGLGDGGNVHIISGNGTGSGVVGSVYIDSGSGGSLPGSVNIGTSSVTTVNIAGGNGINLDGITTITGPSSSAIFQVQNATGNLLAVDTTGNGNITIGNASNPSTITFVGGATGSRPAASGNMGMLYFDTTTGRLLQSNGTKWISAPRTATAIVAASDSSQAEKDAADIVASGTGDQSAITNAISMLSGKGTVYLMEGTYYLSNSILIPNNITLAGAGASTIITIPNAQNGSYNMIANADTTTGTNVTIRDLLIDGNMANQTSGLMYGVNLNGIGSGTTVSGGRVMNLLVENVRGMGISVNSSSNTYLSGNILQNNFDEGIFMGSSTNSTITGNTAQGSTDNGDGISIFGGSNNTVTSNMTQGNTYGIRISTTTDATVTGNTSQGNTDGIIVIGPATGSTFSGNTVQGNSTSGFYISGVSNVAVTGNTVQSNASSGLQIRDSSTNNIISGNQIHDNGGTLNDDGIYILLTSSSNTITDNDISDSSCTNTCYAINITSGTKNYLSNNHYSGSAANAASINDAGTNTIYANQQTNSTTSTNSDVTDLTFRGSANSATAFQIQNASGSSLFTVNTSAPSITLAANVNATANIDVSGSLATKKGTDYATTGLSVDTNFGNTSLVRLTGASTQTIAGIANGRDGYRLTIVNAAGQSATIKNNDTTDETTAANLIITGTGSDLSLGAGASADLVYDSGSSVWRVIGTSSAGGATATLQQAYDASTTSPQITLDSSPGAGGLVVQDNATPLVGNLFTVQSNGGGSKYLQVAATGVTVSNITSTGVITANGGISVAANQTITMAGGATGSRPASPATGTLYYDTTTNQLIQYNGTKWVSDHNTATKIVAASNSTQAEKDAADYVASGTGDEATINTALSAAAGGTVYLMEGTYSISAAISVPNNTTLSGAGTGTLITIPNAQNGTYNMITNTDTTTGTNVVIRDLLIDGNASNQTSGAMTGVYLNGMGAGSGASARPGGAVRNLVVKNLFGNQQAISLSGSNNNSIIGNTAVNDSVGILVTSSSSYNLVSNNVVQGSAGDGIEVGSAYNNIVNNAVQASAAAGISITSTNTTVTGNNLSANSMGIQLAGGAQNTITGNDISGSTSYGVYMTLGTSGNVISSNKIADTGGATANNGIYIIGLGATKNLITGNDITDTSCTTTCYAISLGGSSTAGNTLSNNHFLGDGTNLATINDPSTSTIYSGQQLSEKGDASFRNATNSATAFQVQNAAGTAVLTADTSAGKVVLGTAGASGITGTLQFNYSGSAGSTTLVALDPASGTYTISLPAENGTICTTGSVCTGYQAAVTGGAANQQLSNLSGTVAINQSLNPNADNTLDLGSAANSWRTLYSDTSVITPTVDTGSAIALNIGTSSSVINLNQSTTIAAGKSLKITGDITANRPSSPTAGTLFYDTTTNQLIQYNGTKWVSDRSTATKIVAPSAWTNATAAQLKAEQDAADYIATGTDDGATINSALNSLPATGGGIVYLLPGTYNLGTTAISIPNNTTLSGSGSATLLTFANNVGSGTYYAITNSDTSTGTHVNVQNLMIDGNKSNQSAGTFYGIYFNSVGDDIPLRDGGKINNVIVENIKTASGIYLYGSSNNTVANNTVTGADNDGINDNSGNGNTITGNVIQSNGWDGVYIFAASNNTISGNTIQGNAHNGIETSSASSNTITGNTAQGNSSAGIDDSSSSYDTITGNTAQGNVNYGIQLDSSTSTTVNGNKIHDNGGSTANNGIYLSSTATKNSITGNDITDTSCSTTCYAINIVFSGGSSNYLASNHFLGDGTHAASINDVTGGGNTYSNQPLTEKGDADFRNGIDSATAFQVQNAAGSSIFTLDTQNNGLVSIQAANSLTSGQKHISETFTNGSSTGGSVFGLYQNITVSNTLTGSNTYGQYINMNDSTSLSNNNRGITISLQGTNTSQDQIGVDSSVNHGTGLRGVSSGTSSSAQCGGIGSTFSIGVCGSSSLSGSSLATGVFGATNGTGALTGLFTPGAGVFGNAYNAGSAGNTYIGTKGTTWQNAAAVYTSVAVQGLASAGAGATMYGGYFSLDSGAGATLGSALYATNSTVAANILQLQDNSTDVLKVANDGATTISSINATSGNAVDVLTVTGGNGAGTATAGNGSNISLTAGNGGSGSTANGNGGNITLSAGTAGGGAGSAGTAGSVIVRNQSNSVAAFQVQNAGGATFLNVNTTSNNLSLQALYDTVPIGAELMTNSTTFGAAAGWTSISGTGQSATATHTSGGGTTAISPSPAITVQSGHTYQLIFSITNGAAGQVAVEFGGYYCSNYGGGPYTNERCTGTASSTAPLTFTPSSDSTAIITGVSFKEIIGTAPSTLTINNSDGTAAIEIRTGGSGNINTFIGLNSGANDTTGNNNSALGNSALQNNTTGDFNTAVGSYALKSVASGVENTALGAYALQNATGSYNTAIGSSALGLSGGYDNTALGTNAAYQTSGTKNVALGEYSLYSNTSGSNNTAIGTYAGFRDPILSGFGMQSNLQNATMIGYGAQAQASNVLILGGIGSTSSNLTPNVGIGTTSPNNLFSVSPNIYDTGTASVTSGTATVTGSSTLWSTTGGQKPAAGMVFIFADGTKYTIQSVNSDTSITLTSNATTTESASKYRIHNPAFYVSSTGSTQVRTSTNSATAFQVQNAAGSAILAVDSTNSHLKIFGSTGTNYADIYYDSATSTAYYGANSGKAVLGSGTGPVAITAGPGANFTITGNAASTIQTTAGNLTINAAAYAVVQGSSLSLQATGAANTVAIDSTGAGGAVNIGNSSPGGVNILTGASAGAVTIGNTQSATTITQKAGAVTDTLTNTGRTLTTSTNSTTAFQIQNSSSAPLFGVDTSNGFISINGGNVPALTQWQTNSNSPTGTALNHSGTVIARGYIYTLGGNDGSLFYNTIQYARLNADGSTGAWSSTITLPRNLEDMSPVYANGYIYIFGGVGDATTYRQEVYFSSVNADGTLNGWTQTTNLPALNGMASSVYAPNGYIYVIGGYNSGGAQNTVYYAKPQADGTITSWATNSVNLPGIVRYTGSAAANGYLYVTGGENGTTAQTTVYYGAYNLTTGAISSWTTSANPLTGNARYAHGMVALNNNLYLIGGTDGTNSKDTILYASIGANGANSTWTTDTQHLPAIRNYFGASPVSNGYIYVVRGSDGTNRFNTVYYSSTARLKIGGNVDLVGIAGGANAPQDAGTGGSLTAGNTTIVGTLEVRAQANLLQGGRFGNLISSDNMVQIGSSTTDSTAVVLVVDSYNTASDPAVINGAIYYNSSTNSLRCATGGIWVNCVGGTIVSSTSTATSNACTTACGPIATMTNAWQANACVAGRVYHIYASGVYGTTTTGPTLNLGVYVGTSATKASDTLIGVASNSSTLAASVTALGWEADIYVTCVSTTTATIHGSVSFLSSATTGATVTSKFYTTAAATTVPTTLNNLYIFPTFGTSNASNTITGNQVLVNAL